MSESYKNFDEEEEGKEQKTSFITDLDEDEDFQDAEDDTLFDRKKYLAGKLPFTRDEKRLELKKYFKDEVYSDPLSLQFLDDVEFRESKTADDEVSVYYKDVEVATIDINNKKIHRNSREMLSSGYQTDYRIIIDRRSTTFVGQIEQTIGDQGSITQVISENIKKRFALEIGKRESRGDLSDDIELVNLKEDL